jgi:hypothetical protein
VAILIVLVASLRLVTYNAWADGAWQAYANGVLTSVLLAGVAWPLLKSQVPGGRFSAVLPGLVTVLVLVPGDVVHLLRVGYPVTHTRQAVVDEPFHVSGLEPLVNRRWLFETANGGTLSAAETLTITVPPGGRASAEMRWPRDLNRPNVFWLPRGLFLEGWQESLEWRASWRREGPFLMILDTGTTVVQAASFGLTVRFQSVSGQTTDANVDAPQSADGQPHDFMLERSPDLMRLKIDGQSAWVGPNPAKWRFLRFGESQGDSLRAGSLTLERARYTRAYPPD